MIEQTDLMKLLESYKIDYKKVINDKVLDKGEYFGIKSVLEYLVNELKIYPKNIEKCPSILYLNVNEVRKNNKNAEEEENMNENEEREEQIINDDDFLDEFSTSDRDQKRQEKKKAREERRAKKQKAREEKRKNKKNFRKSLVVKNKALTFAPAFKTKATSSLKYW